MGSEAGRSEPVESDGNGHILEEQRAAGRRASEGRFGQFTSSWIDSLCNVLDLERSHPLDLPYFVIQSPEKAKSIPGITASSMKAIPSSFGDPFILLLTCGIKLRLSADGAPLGRWVGDQVLFRVPDRH